MRLKISLDSERKIRVPMDYTQYIQAVIYNFLDRIASRWLHETGYMYEKRTFKLFAFSYFLETPELDKIKKEFIFQNHVSFIISSPLDWLIKQFVQNIVRSEKIRIGKNNTFISGIEILPSEKINTNNLRINAMTPIEVHSTFKTQSGTKKTYYYSPTEKEFGKLINENQKKKWASFFNENCPYNLEVKPVRAKFCKKRIRKFKNTVIQGFSGHYFIKGEPEFLEFAMATGIGSRNSAGFGMVEVV